MRVLVTGGAGFIGSNLVDRLLDDGHDVTVFDDLSTGKLANLSEARQRSDVPLDFVRIDITSDAVAPAFAKARPDVVLHLAAQMDVRRSVADPVHDAMVNVIGTVNLLEAARRHDVTKFVHTSSGGCIYGEPPEHDLPIAEDYPGHPHSPYGASKRGVEEYLHTYQALYGLRWTSLALANVYGPRQDPAGEAGVVSIFGGRMLADEPLTIFGDGEQTRDFVAVDDVVDAFVRAIEDGDGMRCNIGTQRQTSVNELFSVLADLTGYEQAPRYEPERPGELRHSALDISVARRALGWQPQLGLEAGLSRVVDWMRS